MSVLRSLGYAVANLLHPRMLRLMVWPMLVALAIWGVAAAVLWTKVAMLVAGIIQHWLESAAFFTRFDFADAALIAAHVALFLLFVPVVYLTALFILGVFGMQEMVAHVASRSFPNLERQRGGGIVGSAWNGVVALLGLIGLAIVSLPLWLLPPLWPLVPLFIFAWVNQRLLRYDALAGHADRQEMARLVRERRGHLYLLGVLFALLAYVPLLGFLAPVLFGLAFIHYLLGALAELRAAGR